MAAVVDKTAKKLVLNMEKGTQTVSPVLNDATDEQVYNTSIAVATLLAPRVKTVHLVETEYIIDDGNEEAGE